MTFEYYFCFVCLKIILDNVFHIADCNAGVTLFKLPFCSLETIDVHDLNLEIQGNGYGIFSKKNHGRGLHDVVKNFKAGTPFVF